jgi:hypothetical protein
MRENKYQSDLIKKIKKLIPGCEVLKNDAQYKPGIPDLTVFYGERWVMLEVKVSADAPQQPNQEHYVRVMNDMSYAAFIHPDNEAEVLHEVQRALGIGRATRLSKSK